MATAKAARSATSVLPKPTSPQISRSIGLPAARSSVTASIAAALVVGLLIRETRLEFGNQALRRHDHRRLLQGARGGNVDELAGHLADALLQPRLARLPGDAAELVELGLRVLGTVARQELDILHRKKELVAARVVKLETGMRRAHRLDGRKADEAPDAVIDMHDDVAGGERRRFADDVLGLASPGATSARGGRRECPARR